MGCNGDPDHIFLCEVWHSDLVVSRRNCVTQLRFGVTRWVAVVNTGARMMAEIVCVDNARL